MSELQRLAAEYRKALAWFTSCQRATIRGLQESRQLMIDNKPWQEATARYWEARRVEGAAGTAFQDAQGRLLACARKEP